MLFSNLQIRIFCIAMLLLALLVAVGGEWYFHQANTRQSRRRQELVACYHQAVRETIDSVEARNARHLEHSWGDFANGPDGKAVIFKKPVTGAAPGSNQQLFNDLRNLSIIRYKSFYPPVFCAERLTPGLAGNAFTPCKLALLYFDGCGPFLHGLSHVRSSCSSTQKAILRPIIPGVVAFCKQSALPDSLTFTVPKATGGYLPISLPDGFSPR